MAVRIERGVDFPMVDLANIAYYPRIFDLAHRFFEDAWMDICNIRYADLILVRKTGFPVVHVESEFHLPLRYGDQITATIWIDAIGESSCTWCYEFHNQHGQLLWTSSQVTVCVEMESMKRRTIPDDLRLGLESCKRDD
ncbi:MAG: acyl-CoA thioesterase [Candidatus Thermoplasmatota archaeon]|nr:acyl-CoA thioesterase [Candidatus Thermoplasmatota archaeon]MEC8609377.1 acyl-CoA thioesterase [Candidatus Thermoplasmatota archaeon]